MICCGSARAICGGVGGWARAKPKLVEKAESVRNERNVFRERHGRGPPGPTQAMVILLYPIVLYDSGLMDLKRCKRCKELGEGKKPQGARGS